MDCLFCKLKDLQGNYLCENDSFYCIADKYPASPGHSLAILKTHKESFFELTDREMADARDALAQLEKILDEKHKPDAYNIAVNEGEAAGRTIHHVHIHLVPRYRGQGPQGGIEAILKSH